MIYGIIYNHGQGKHAFVMRQFTQFKSREEEKRLSPYIVAILEEETGDGLLLAEKIASYVRKNHLELELPIDLTGISRAASLSQDERIEMLESSVRTLARRLDETQKRVWDLEYAYWYMDREQEGLLYLLEDLRAIFDVAKVDFKCKHIDLAFEKKEQWKKDHLQ